MSQKLKAILRRGKKWDDLSDAQKESLEMIASKIARALSGEPNEPDHWIDISGYSQLIVNELEDNTDVGSSTNTESDTEWA